MVQHLSKYGLKADINVANNSTASTDPDAWRIVDGKSVQRTWEKDIPGNIVSADRNWPEELN